MTLRVEVRPAARWAEQVAGEWSDRLVTNRRLRMCLASGGTPGPVYQALVSGGASMADADVILLDEFIGLPTGHPGRCESMLRRQLIDLVEVGRFHRMDVDADDLDAECSRIDELIAQGGIDLAVLGLGLNGHLGMNEPGSEPGDPTRVVELAPETRDGLRRYGIDASLDRGLTLGMAQLLASAEVWLLVTGERKREILRRVLEDSVGPRVPGVVPQGAPQRRRLGGRRRSRNLVTGNDRQTAVRRHPIPAVLVPSLILAACGAGPGAAGPSTSAQTLAPTQADIPGVLVVATGTITTAPDGSIELCPPGWTQPCPGIEVEAKWPSPTCRW